MAVRLEADVVLKELNPKSPAKASFNPAAISSFTYIPDIRKLNIDDITEENFYTLIGLTKDEISLFIKKNIVYNSHIVWEESDDDSDEKY
jgi:hypothetical protein